MKINSKEIYKRDVEDFIRVLSWKSSTCNILCEQLTPILVSGSMHVRYLCGLSVLRVGILQEECR